MRIFALVFLLLSFAAVPASANVYLKLGLLYQSILIGPEGGEATTRTSTDIGLGYVGDRGWLVGFLSGSDSYSNDYRWSGEALSLGWFSRRDTGGFLFMFEYFLQAKSDSMSGSGYQLDFGYLFRSRGMAFGPQLTKRAITFDKADGNALSPKQLNDGIHPSLVFWIEF